MESSRERLADGVGFALLGSGLAEDVEASVATALEAGVVFPRGATPLAVFRDTLTRSIREIERTDPRVDLLERFLHDMTYDWSAERDGQPADPIATAHLDGELADVVKFITGHMVNRFQGGIAELLAAAPCELLMSTLQQEGRLPATARLHAADAVTAAQLERAQRTYAADFHILVAAETGTPTLSVAGVVEVKSYHCCTRRLTKEVREQIDKHLARVRLGLTVCDASYDHVTVGLGRHRPALKVVVVPDRWKLPRTFQFQETDGKKVLRVDPARPPTQPAITRLSDGDWKITLRWSQEALVEAAYEMVFWYMGKLGEAIYSQSSPWPHMTPFEAGRNASKMMLNLAVARLARDRPGTSHAECWRQYQLAIGLYNAFSFGYALGMNFRNKEDGARELLSPEDLDEILKCGRTTYRLRDPTTKEPVGPEHHCRILQ